MTLNILVDDLQAKGKPVKRGENNIETAFRGINETLKNVGNFMAGIQKVLPVQLDNYCHEYRKL